MSSLAQSNRFLRLSLVSPCASISLAAPTLARHLGISQREAVKRLSAVPGTLSDRLETFRAQQLASLLGALGVAIRLDLPQGRQKSFKPIEVVFDLSVQPVDVGNIDELAAALHQSLPTNLWSEKKFDLERLRTEIAGPGGLVLENLAAKQINEIRRRLRKTAGLRIAVSNKATAVYDILPDPRISGALPDGLASSLAYLGVGACILTGAVAARVDGATKDHVLKRFGSLGLVALNQDFQRFDLFLTGVRNLSPRELADFLVVRSELPRQMLERMPRPLKIETGLTRANALAFQSDYTALGLETCARLRIYHPLPEKVEN